MRNVLSVAVLFALPLVAATVERAAGGPNRAVIDPLFDCVLPQIITGGGFKTSIVIVNLGASEAKTQLYFLDSDARDQEHPWVGVGMANSLIITIPGRGSYTVQSEDALTLREGWSLLVQDGVANSKTYGQVAVHVMMEYEGREMIIPMTTMAERRTLIPVDNTGDVTTMVCVINFDPAAQTIRLKARATNGSLIDEGTLEAKSFARICFDTKKVPGLEGKRGIGEVSTAGTFMSVYGARFNPNGNGTMATFTSFSLRDWQF